MNFSVIIPTLNEEKNIGKLIQHFQNINHPNLKEIIVSDAGSTDNTKKAAENAGVIFLKSPKKGRACQMNFGAKKATGDILYFVHADVQPPNECFNNILNVISDEEPMGCFSYEFDSNSKWLKFNAIWNKFDWAAAGGGDQTLYIKKDIFWQLNGFDEEHCIMEDFDFVKRAKKKYPFKVIKNNALVSDRKFENNNYFKVQIANILVFTLYRFGVAPERLKSIYYTMVR